MSKAAVRDGVHGRLGQLLHLDEPLVGQERLDRRLRAVAKNADKKSSIFSGLMSAEANFSIPGDFST